MALTAERRAVAARARENFMAEDDEFSGLE